MRGRIVRSLQISMLFCAASVSLSACGSSDWAARTAQAHAAEKSGNLQRAESEYRAAIASAEKAHLPESAYAAAIHGLGKILLNEKKFGASVPFLVRSCQLATATRMSDDDNIALLQDVVVALEKSGEYKEAADTQAVLMTFLSVEKSPADPVFVAESANQKRLEALLADYDKQHLAATGNAIQQ